MAFPADLALVTVNVQFDLPTTGGAAGTVTFTARWPLLGPSAGSIVPPFGRTILLDANGAGTVILPATNDPQWTPVDWAYEVTARVGGRSVYGSLQLDHATPSVQLADLLQISGSATPGVTYATLAQLQAYVDSGELAAALDGYPTTAEMDAAFTAWAYTINLAYDLASKAIPKLDGEVVDSLTVWRKLNYGSAVRIRATGEAVDIDWINDLIFGRYDQASFAGDGSQRLRLHGAGTVLAKLTEFGTGVYGGDQYVDADGGKAAFGGKNDAVPMIQCGYLAGAGAPASGAWDAGQFLVRDDGWWRCTVTGTPGTWAKAV